MKKQRIIIKQNLPCDNPPHPKDSPVQISYDMDLGWIVEDVYEGEYEVLEFPYRDINTMGKFAEPNIDLAIQVANGREIWICPK